MKNVIDLFVIQIKIIPMSQQTYLVFTYMHMCKQTKKIKKWCRFRAHCGTFFSVIDFGKNVGGMQKLLRSTHNIILRISTLIKAKLCIKVHTILELLIHL